MHSKDNLAAALRDVGLTAMADKAATGYYHDYLSPLSMPSIQLANDLALAAKDNIRQRAAIIALRARHLDGEFDATTEESEHWAKSKEGQATMAKLVRKPR